MARKLYYFDFKGLAESLRYLLHAGELEFEDVRISREKWPEVKVELNTPLGKIPLYVEGDKRLNQSLAIAKHIGKLANLVPSDSWEEAQLDAVLLNWVDLFIEIKPGFFEQDPEKKEALKKKARDETIPFYYSKFEKQIQDNNGHLGKELSWADIVLVGHSEMFNDVFEFDLFQDYPNFGKLSQEVFSLKGIKAYRDNRK